MEGMRPPCDPPQGPPFFSQVPHLAYTANWENWAERRAGKRTKTETAVQPQGSRFPVYVAGDLLIGFSDPVRPEGPEAGVQSHFF